MVALFLPPQQQFSTSALTPLLNAEMAGIQPQAAIYYPDSGTLRLYGRRLLDHQLDDPSRRGRPAGTVELTMRPSFDDVRDALQFLGQEIQVWNGCGATQCELCDETYQHHSHCPVAFRHHRASYFRAFGEYHLGLYRGYMGEVRIAAEDVRSSFGLGVLRGQETRRRDSAVAMSLPVVEGADHG